MASKIQLTPQELLSQSQEMFDLQAAYEDLFKQSGSLLEQVNSNWSENLARNFTGKILSAQQSFGRIGEMLRAGGDLAATSANTFESMDQLLARSMAGDGVLGSVLGTATAGVAAAAGSAVAAGGAVAAGSAATLTASVPDLWEQALAIMEAGGTLPQELIDRLTSRLSSNHMLEDFEASMAQLPEAARDAAKKLFKEIFGKDVSAATQIAWDILSGNADWDTLKTFLGTFMDGTTLKVCFESFKYALSERVGKLDAYYMDAVKQDWLEGNIVTGVFDMAGAFVDEVLGGCVDVGGSLVVDVLDNLPGSQLLQDTLGFDISESWDSVMEGFHEGLTDTIEHVTDFVGDAEDFVQDRVDDVIDFGADVLNAAGEGISKLGDAVSNFFNW